MQAEVMDGKSLLNVATIDAADVKLRLFCPCG
jgi:hypothetical protein